MDNPYQTCCRLARWIERGPLPTIPFVGYTRCRRMYNPPAPHLEVSFRGGLGTPAPLRIGALPVLARPYQVSIHNVHLGNYSDPADDARQPVASRRGPGWNGVCLFLDMSDWTGWADWTTQPRWAAMPVREVARLRLMFDTLIASCLVAGQPEPRYVIGPAAHDPSLPGHDDPVRQLRIRAALLNLIACLMDNAREQDITQGQRGDDSQRLMLAVDHMRHHLADPSLSLERLAQVADLSEAYFGRLFRQWMNLSPMRYLRQLRLEQAAHDLRTTDWPIARVAAEVGYDDPLYFSRLFRQAAGVSPRAFREHGPGRAEAVR